MIKIEKEKCCGCGACAAICPKRCIEMQEDEEGFLYPHVCVEECISCECCIKVCPSLLSNKKDSGQKVYKPVAVGGSHKNEAILKKSTSGGAFTLFANEIIKHGGMVYGCTLDKDLMPVHAGVWTVEDIDKLRGAKYVQSLLGDIFSDVKKTLNEGKEVLFTGTPCECASLDTYLGETYENLYLCDFVCHGVPSRGIFRSWKDYQERRYHDKIVNIMFRNKDLGWNSKGSRLQKGVKVVFRRTNKQHILALFDTYINGFLENVYLRPSCYFCAFKGARMHSDITIADFWGVNKVNKALYNHKGTSLIILNTPKGAKLFESVKGEFEHKICMKNEALSHNKSYFESAKPHPKREQFFAEYRKKGIEYVIKKYLTPWRCIEYRLFHRK